MVTIAVNDGRSFLEEQGLATGPGHGKDPGQGPYTGGGWSITLGGDQLG